MSSMQTRLEFADNARGIAILMVLIIHSAKRYDCGVFWNEALSALSVLSLSCIAVFLFLSGYLVGNREWKPTHLWKRCSRVLIPYLIVSVFAFLYGDAVAMISGGVPEKAKLLLRLLLGHSFGIYYFVFVIVGMYVFHFFMVKWAVDPKNLAIGFLIVLIAHHVIYPTFVEPHIGVIGKRFYTNRFPFWPFFFYLGVWLSKPGMAHVVTGIQRFFKTYWGIALFVGCGLAHVILASNGVGNSGKYDSIACSVWSVVTISMMVSLDYKLPFLAFLSRYSYSIYLMHIFVVYALRDYVFAGYLPSLSFPIASLALSLLIPILLISTIYKYSGKQAAALLGA